MIGGIKVQLLLPCALALAAVAAGPAGAATDLGVAGTKLDVAMTSDGSAYVARFGSDTRSIVVCRIPAGGTGCTQVASLSLPVPSTDLQTGPWVVTDGTKVVVVAGDDNGGQRSTWASVSSTPATGGYGAPAKVSNIEAKDVDLSPAGDRLWITAQSGAAGDGTNDYLAFSSAPLPPGSTTSYALLAGSPTFDSTSVGGQVSAVKPDGKPLAFVAGFGPGLPSGDYDTPFNQLPVDSQLNDRTKWGPLSRHDIGAPFERNGEYDAFSGYGRTWLAYEGLNTDVILRPYTTGWGTPIQPNCAPSNFAAGTTEAPDVAIGRTGDLEVAYVGSQDFVDHLVYLHGNADGSAFSARQELASAPGIQDVETASDPTSDSGGVVVWSQGAHVWFSRLPDAPFATCASGSTPPATPPAVTPPVAQPPATKTITATVPGATLKFGVPGRCVAPGKTFKVTLAFKTKKRKGNNFVKVTRVDFSVDGQKKKTDRTAPFRQTLKVKAATRSGSRITVRARAYIKVHHGRPPKKSIRTTVKVC